MQPQKTAKPGTPEPLPLRPLEPSNVKGPRTAPASPFGGDGPIADTVRREPIIRYFRKMFRGKLYPLVVTLKGEGGFGDNGTGGSVIVQPVIPGATVTPAVAELSTLPGSEARFWVLPQVYGKLPGARIELRAHGRVLQNIPVPMKIRRRRLTWFFVLLTIALPLLLWYCRKTDVEYTATISVPRQEVGGKALEWDVRADPDDARPVGPNPGNPPANRPPVPPAGAPGTGGEGGAAPKAPDAVEKKESEKSKPAEKKDDKSEPAKPDKFEFLAFNDAQDDAKKDDAKKDEKPASGTTGQPMPPGAGAGRGGRGQGRQGGGPGAGGPGGAPGGGRPGGAPGGAPPRGPGGGGSMTLPPPPPTQANNLIPIRVQGYDGLNRWFIYKSDIINGNPKRNMSPKSELQVEDYVIQGLVYIHNLTLIGQEKDKDDNVVNRGKSLFSGTLAGYETMKQMPLAEMYVFLILLVLTVLVWFLQGPSPGRVRGASIQV